MEEDNGGAEGAGEASSLGQIQGRYTLGED